METIILNQPMGFRTKFRGIMDMYSDRKTVTDYLNNHQGWFVRCASPMKVEPFSENGYTLTVGRYGAFGYEVEPQMSVILEPPMGEHYTMYSVTNPESGNDGYEVDYYSVMDIETISGDSIEVNDNYCLPPEITRINWELDLRVRVYFPKFIYKIPTNMIQSTGDRLLSQIVKQVSPRLSFKVQKDFHSHFDLPIPPKKSRTCEIVKQTNQSQWVA
ncbi:DUF1997 domain-containing protein [Cyanobacterium stanieri LEGE 03274]|uniref:DUF1997 domain-containing protein n=2 Tax=Cyanobacterium TaxID=102234 RepID=A0ABR9V2X6_9CHRO|nr:DUF1997 domain-containing protein [Cyanobacterium stanieri LEGE 03274]